MTQIASALLGAAAMAGALAVTLPAQAQPYPPPPPGDAAPPPSGSGVKVGVLTCNEQSGWGFIFGSSRKVRCTYSGVAGNPPSRYNGDINTFGVDIGYRGGGVLIWSVIAPTGDVAPGALQGSYGGVTASATAVVGVGANALVGGLNRSFTLQPLSIEGTTGLNVAAGIGAMNLHYVPPPYGY